MNWDEYWGTNAPSYYGDMQGRPLTQQEYLAQQQMYNQQMYNQQMANQQFRNPTKKEIMDCLIASTGANEVVKVDEFELYRLDISVRVIIVFRYYRNLSFQYKWQVEQWV